MDESISMPELICNIFEQAVHRGFVGHVCGYNDCFDIRIYSFYSLAASSRRSAFRAISTIAFGFVWVKPKQYPTKFYQYFTQRTINCVNHLSSDALASTCQNNNFAFLRQLAACWNYLPINF